MAKETNETNEIVETTVNLPKGVDQETYDKAKNIIVSGFENDAEPDVIKTAMFSEGIPFSQLVRLFKAITINEKLVRDPKEIRAEIGAAIAEYDFDVNTTWDDIEKIVEAIKEKVKGATEKKITSHIKNVMEEKDLEYPRKPRAKKGGRSGGSKISAAILKYFQENEEPTKEGFAEAMGEITTEKSLKKWVRMYDLFSGLAAIK